MVRFGVPGQNVDPLAYADGRLSTVPVVNAPRRPTTTDKKYPMWCEWRVNKDASSPATEGEFWKLVRFESNGDATWQRVDVSGSSPGVDDIRDQVDAQVTPDSSGFIDIDGAAVANAANPSGIPLETVADATTSTLDVQIQVGAAITGAPGDKNDAGICSFNDTHFSVDADGYVSLIGGGIAIDTISGDDGNAVTPDGSGNFNLAGVAVASGTNAKPVYFKQSGSANTVDLDIQVGGARTGAPADKNDAGICSFDDTAFAVDGNGYVTLVGGPGPAVDSIDVQNNTAPGTDPVVPSGTGQVAIAGAAVAAHSVPIETHSRAANAFNVEVQYADATATSTAASSGICHFDSDDFTVDASGYVQLKEASAGEFLNLGISYAAGTFTVNGEDGTALSATNPGYVTLQSVTNPGQLTTIAVTANQSFNDDAHASSDIVNNLFGFTTGTAITDDVPFFLYACLNDAQDAVTFGISRIPHRTRAPATANIGTPATANADEQYGIFLFNSVTIGDYDTNPVTLIGSFRMKMSAADDWTVQTLTTQDGVGTFQEGIQFNTPKGQFGANAGTSTIPNGGTPPNPLGQDNNVYWIDRDGNVTHQFLITMNNANGAGAVSARITSPFFASEGNNNDAHVGTGFQWIANGNNVIQTPEYRGGSAKNQVSFKSSGLASNQSLTWGALNGAGSTGVSGSTVFKADISG